GCNGAAGVETEPTEPEKRSAEDDHTRVVILHLFLAEAEAGTQDEGRYQGRNARADMHDGAAGQLQGAEAAEPARITHASAHWTLISTTMKKDCMMVARTFFPRTRPP